MARKSTSSSAQASNGQTVTPTDDTDAALRQSNTDSSRPSDLKAAFKVDLDDRDKLDRPGLSDPRQLPCDASLYANGSRSLAAIGEQSLFLGVMLATSVISLLRLTFEHDPPHPYWRLAAFILCLSIFHFLEFETTARFNLPATRSSSFLLFTNGMAYNVAYALAMVEIIVSGFFPNYQSLYFNRYTFSAGLALIVVGQVVRSTAMVQAGTNFNHTPVTKRIQGHDLVTKGVYGWLRHPSYFGFFWWAIGTQLLVGNKACFVGYVLVLWKFFHQRIIR